MTTRSALFFFALLVIGNASGQTAPPDHIPEMKYPPIARAAHVQGDVVVAFRQTADGVTADVTATSGPAMLRGIAIENVKAWRFPAAPDGQGRASIATFHFQFEYPQDGYNDDDQPSTRVELDGKDGVRVLTIATTGLNRSECPTAAERVPPRGVINGDFVELRRWNEVVRVGADGSIAWQEREGGVERSAHISRAGATALLEQFRTSVAWGMCGDYSQAGLLDGGSSSFKVRLGGREKKVGEYGDAAPRIFDEVEDAVDAAANTHRWRHGDPSKESIVEISHEELPKPGKTKLMDAVATGDKVAIKAVFATGDKVTDVDASGWTPLMYAAGAYGNSGLKEMLAAGSDVNARSRRGETALMAAAAKGDADEDLIKAGASVNAANDVGMTTLMLLAQRGEPDEVTRLLKAGADARMKDQAGRTALDYLNAANCGRPIVEAKDPEWISVGYSECSALGDDYPKSKRLLISAGAKATRVWSPKKLSN